MKYRIKSFAELQADPEIIIKEYHGNSWTITSKKNGECLIIDKGGFSCFGDEIEISDGIDYLYVGDFPIFKWMCEPIDIPIQEHLKEDSINPSHYKSHPSGIECIDITRHFNFNIGNVIKYLWRQGLKDGNSSLQELKKAKWYLEDEIRRVENETN